MNFHKMMQRFHYMNPAAGDGEGSAGGAAAVDRGDTLAGEAGKIDDPDAQAKADAQAEIDRIEAEKAAKAKGDDAGDEGAGDEGDEGGEGDEGAAEGKKAKGKDTRIPLNRHKEIIEKERAQRAALEAQLKQYQDGAKVADINAELTAAENDLIKLEGEYTKLMIDGEAEKAAAKMAEIRKLDRSISEQKSDMKVQAAESRAVERVRFDTVVERVEAAYPVMNPDHDDYDQETVQDVIDLKVTYERRGATPSAALQKAVTKLLGAETKKQETATTVTPKVDAATVAAERKEAATKAGIDAAKKTPATSAKAGIDTDKLGGGITAKNVMNMSQSEFAKLDPSLLADLRGDKV